MVPILCIPKQGLNHRLESRARQCVFSPTTVMPLQFQHISTSMYVKKKYLYNPDEDFELIDMKLLVHALSQPGCQQIHSGCIPLLQSTKTQHSPAKHRQTNKQMQETSMCRHT